MGWPCQAGNLPAPRPWGSCASLVSEFFSMQISVHVSDAHVGAPGWAPWPRRRNHGTGTSLWPWGRAGASGCQCWQCFVSQTQPRVAVPHPVEAPFMCTLQSHRCRSYRSERHPQTFPDCAALVTGCTTKQPKNPCPGQPLQHSCAEGGCRQPEPSEFLLIFFCWAWPLTHCSQKHSGAPVKELLERQTAFMACNQQGSFAIYRPNPTTQLGGSKADAGRMPTPTKDSILHAREAGIPSPYIGLDMHIASRAALLGNAFNPKLIWQAKGLDPEQSLKVAVSLPPLHNFSPIFGSAVSPSLCQEHALRPWLGREVKTCSRQIWGTQCPISAPIYWVASLCALWERAMRFHRYHLSTDYWCTAGSEF